MARVKTGTSSHQRHKKLLKMARGYWMSRHRLVKRAKEAVIHAGQYAYVGRKRRKRDFRRLWIQRINAGLSLHDISYSQFINRLKKAKIELNRKILADLALRDPEVFKLILDKVNKE